MKKKVFWIVILFIFILLAIAGYVIYKKWELVNARDNFISAIESYKSSNNYYMLVESKESNNTLKHELYSKDGKSIYYSYFYFPEFDEDGPTDKIYYYDGINTQIVIENKDNKREKTENTRENTGELNTLKTYGFTCCSTYGEYT